ncbi:MAG: HAMP domain-containing histidine kinase [Dysgonamonadaceae bacterium]|jgi:signal transduction histidine kinase|nr:HAMP domain-containing histidine kinase [Dysgonamonadaceae bacterium]
MKPTFTQKLTFSFCLILALFAMGAVVFGQYRAGKYRTEALEEKLDGYAEIAYRYLCNRPASPGPDAWQPLLSLLPPNLRLTVIDEKGTVCYDNRLEDVARVENHAERPEIIAAKRNGRGSDIRESSSDRREYLYYARHFDRVYIRIANPYDNQVQHFLKPDNSFLYYLLVLFFAGILFINYTAGHFGKTIKRLRDYSQAIDRQIAVEIPAFPTDEIGEIGEQIARDYKRLKESETKLASEHEQLQRQIQIRQEMTGNIAHELRTPVTGIRGYLETIMENRLDRDKEREFVHKAYEQIITLSELIRDMSLLAKINEAPHSFRFETIHLCELIRKVQTDLEEELRAKDVVLYSTIPQWFRILGNGNLLYSIFRNLMDNVVRYAGESVTISIRLCGEDGGFAYFSFSDNGVGIEDEKHLNRLFERFYRINEGRTRETGGSGLGLSIVKNAVAFHGGTISARNRAEGGLEFLFNLPTDTQYLL